ncbi:MAG: DUF4424 family protein [Micropepsaceae bacterium]
MRTYVCAVLVSLCAMGMASANDGFLGLPAGGLTLQKSADIVMVDEDLYLSLDQVRVNYQFRNVSAVPVTAQIGFPMPGLPVSVNFDGDTGYDIHDVKDLELLKFETRVEGQVVKSRPVVRAFIFPKNANWDHRDRFRFTDATDITGELRAAGFPLNFDARAIRAAYARLPAAVKADWSRRGMYSKEASFEQPEWFLSTIFVREQTFFPGRIVHVQHNYKPFPSGFVMVSNHFAYDRQLAIDTCVDAPTERAIKRILTPRNGGGGHVIDYVLTTANTWKGPIGHFRLTIDKGSPRNIVSFCGTGVRKTGATTFVVEARNFKPTQDIKVLIVQGYQP